MTIRSYTLYRWGRSEGTYERGRDYWLYNEAPYLDDRAYRFPQEVCSRFVGCQELGITGDPFAPFNRVDRRDLQIKQVYVVNQCHAADAAGCPPTSPASTFALYSARFELVDPHAPTFRGNPSGSLIQPGEVLTGERSVHLQAADLGSGLLWAGVTVDGQVQDSQPVDPNDRDCRPPYTGVVPCPLIADSLVSLDTATLPDGPHVVQVRKSS